MVVSVNRQVFPCSEHRLAKLLTRVSTRRCAIAVGLLTLCLVGCALYPRYLGQPFDPVAWQDPSQLEQGVRLAMADRFIAQDTLIGKTRAEVIRLLGKPSDEGYFRSWDLVYWLGPERGYMSIDSEWLVLRIGSDDKVVECRIVRD